MVDPDVARIRDHRRRYNVAIRGRDLATIAALWLPDYVVLPGAIGTPLARDAGLAMFETLFADPTYVEHARRDETILIAAGRKRASETGLWRGLWRTPQGERVVTGIYQAMWLPAADDWRLLNESFVTLNGG